jgi:hypothetical protein
VSARTRADRVPCALGRFHHDLALEHDVEAGAGLATLDQHLSGAERELGARRLELAQIVLVHEAEYRTAVVTIR